MQYHERSIFANSKENQINLFILYHKGLNLDGEEVIGKAKKKN